MHPILTIAVQAVRQAGNFIIKNYEKYYSKKIFKNNKQLNLVYYHQNIKYIIIKIIKKYYPTHIIFTKTNKLLTNKNEIQWVINPLDGLINFNKRSPHFAISIAVRINNYTEIAVVYDPILDELFTAIRGNGTKLNNYRLRLDNVKRLDKAIIALGYFISTTNTTTTNLVKYKNIYHYLLNKCADFRRTGSTALDLAYVAANRFDIFYEINLKYYNFLAGELLIREAGGSIIDLINNTDNISSGNLIASNPQLIHLIDKVILQFNNINNNIK